MIIFRAAWLCPVTRPPIKDGWVAVDAGRIVACGAPHEPMPPGHVRDYGDAAVLPGLVNAHTHLELSWLRGRVPPAASFVDWVKQLFVARGGRIEDADHPDVVGASIEGCKEARAMGTALVGDISNSLASVGAIRNAGLRGLVFHELLGFNLRHGESVDATRPAREAAMARGGATVKVTLAPHAPYSVSPELLRAIRQAVSASEVPITSIHVGESGGEVEFLETGGGPWPGMLRWVGSWREDWETPRCGPVEYLDRLEILDARTLVVHGVQLGDCSLARLAEIGCTLVTCPRSNQWVGVGAPPIERFYASGVRVAVGTDSLASVDDLNLFAELKAMRWLAPSVPARRLIESATICGAEALGFASELGSIEPRKAAALIAVDVPEDTIDVEEYLVSGIEPSQVQWIDEMSR